MCYTVSHGNYQRKLDRELEALGERRPSLLLHSCCGPCSTYVLEYLTRHFSLGLLYFDPNIQPRRSMLSGWRTSAASWRSSRT